jgi:hypothetical protein
VSSYDTFRSRFNRAISVIHGHQPLPEVEMGNKDLRSIFEQIAHRADHVYRTADARFAMLRRDMQEISSLCEQGISSITHTSVETREPVWEEHPKAPRWMMERGVEGDFFNPHLENDECKVAGCRPAFPGEIPRNSPELDAEFTKRTMTPTEYRSLFTNEPQPPT